MCSHEFGAERRIRPARAAAGGRFAICDCRRPSCEGNWAREGFPGRAPQSENAKRLHRRGSTFSDKSAGCVRGGRLHPGPWSGFHRDGGSRWKVGGAGDTRKADGKWLICELILRGFARPIRSGWPRRRRPIPARRCIARLRRDGGERCGKRFARRDWMFIIVMGLGILAGRICWGSKMVELI